MICFNSIYLITFIFFFLSCCSHNFFIMSKCHSDHLFLFHAIVKEDVEMSHSCDCCSFFSKQYFVSDKFKKCSECVKLKYSCFFFHSLYFTDISCLLHAYERLDHDEKFILKKHQKLSTHLIELNVKILQL